MKDHVIDWEEHDRVYAALGPRFSYKQPCECFMCGKRIVNPNSRVLIQLMDDGPCGNAHVDCVGSIDTEIIVKRHAEALAAAVSGKNESPHPVIPYVVGRNT